MLFADNQYLRVGNEATKIESNKKGSELNLISGASSRMCRGPQTRMHTGLNHFKRTIII